MDEATRLIKVTLLLALLVTVAIVGARTYFPFRHRALIQDIASEFEVDPALVAAVIRRESGFRADATSPQGARGLMQVMPQTGKWVATRLEWDGFDPQDLYDPAINVRFGTFYLRDLQKVFEDDLVLVLAAYNGGRQNVRNWLAEKGANSLTLDDIPFAETRRYVEKVLNAYGWYQVLYGWEPRVFPPS